jgi:hypothetical protein
MLLLAMASYSATVTLPMRACEAPGQEGVIGAYGTSVRQ